MRALLSLAFLTVLLPTAVHGQNNTFKVSGTTGETGDVFTSTVSFDTVDVLQGWSFGVCHDDINLTLLSTAEGATTLTINGGLAPGFISLEDMPNPGPGVTMGVVIDLFGVNTLPIGTDYEILNTMYQLIGVPGIDPITTNISICNTLGTPAVPSLAVVLGSSIPADVVDGLVTIIPPPEFCLDLTCVGAQTSVAVTWDDCSRFDYFLLHRDGILIQTLDGTMLSYDDLALDPGSYHYALIGVDFPDPQGSPMVFVAECDVDVIPLIVDGLTPIVGPYTGGTLITVTGTGFISAVTTTVDFGGVAPLDLTIVSDSELTFTSHAVTMLGPVDLTVTNLTDVTLTAAFTYGFVRGDANGDGTIDLADGISVLEYLFNMGATPECLDSADVNNDGLIDIADGIFLLSYLFDLGAAPPPPFATAGMDTGISLGCL